MGCPLNVGDDVIAYWYRQPRFAFAGNVKIDMGAKIFIPILICLFHVRFYSWEWKNLSPV